MGQGRGFQIGRALNSNTRALTAPHTHDTITQLHLKANPFAPGPCYAIIMGKAARRATAPLLRRSAPSQAVQPWPTSSCGTGCQFLPLFLSYSQPAPCAPALPCPRGPSALASRGAAIPAGRAQRGKGGSAPSQASPHAVMLLPPHARQRPSGPRPATRRLLPPPHSPSGARAGAAQRGTARHGLSVSRCIMHLTHMPLLRAVHSPRHARPTTTPRRCTAAHPR